MSSDMVTLKIMGGEKQYPKGTSFFDVAKEYQKQYEDDIVLVVYNNRLRELKKTMERDGELSFVTTADKTGKKTYRRSVTLLMQKAVCNLWGDDGVTVRVMYSLGQGYYCELRGKNEEGDYRVAVDGDKIAAIKAEMQRLVEADLEIEKRSMNTDDAIALFP